MKIAIICSIDFASEVRQIKNLLESKGHIVSVPYSIEKILKDQMTLQQVADMRKTGTFSDYAKSKNLIRWNWDRMKGSDVVLVINLDKNDIKNYIGGNTFLEMGFAHIANMKIFLWNDIPEMIYTDEIKVINPIVLNQNIDKIQ